MCQNLISGRIPLLFRLPRKVRNTASLGSRSGHRKRFLKFTQAGKIPHCAHQRLYILFPKLLHIICNCLNLKRRSLICRLRYKQRQRIWNGFADNQHRQNQICKQADSFPVSSDSENFQNSAEQSLLFLPKYIVLFFGQAFENPFLFFNRQHCNTVFFTVTAGMQKLYRGFVKGQGRIVRQTLRICNQSGLLQIQRLYDQILFCLKERIEKGS